MGELLLTGGFAAVVARVTILLGLAIFAVLAMRRTSAATRHGVLASAAAASLAAPFLTLLGPTWSLPVLTPTVEPIAASSVPPAPAFDRLEAVMLPPRDATIGPPTRPVVASPVVSSAPPWTWSQRLLAIWAAGAAVATIPGIVVGVRLRRLARRSQPLAGPPWDAMLDDLRGRLGVRGRVRLIQSDAVAAPMTWGVFRPIVALPLDAAAWPEDRLRAVLAHELAHVARRDALAQVPARLACVIYWFHPLAWWTASRMLVERERACDDLVLAAGWRGVDYAQRLLEVAQGLCGRSGFAGVAAMARTSQVEDRVRAILDASRNHRPLGRRGVLALAAATAALVVPLASARLVAQAAQAPAEALEAARMTISGRVLDPEGKPIAGAKVAVVGHRKRAPATGQWEGVVMLGRGEADGEGRFDIRAPRISSARYTTANVLCRASGFGVGWARFDRDALAPTVDVSLRPEQPLDVRFLTPDGKPATGLDVRTLILARERASTGQSGPPSPSLPLDAVDLVPRMPPELGDLWPAELKTDAEGRITFTGLSRNARAFINLGASRFQTLYVVNADVPEGKNRIDVTLRPAMRISGVVTAADTGRPIPGAALVVSNTPIDPSDKKYGGSHDRTDSQGRYEAMIPPSSNVSITIYPPSGTPYPTWLAEIPAQRDGEPQVRDLSGELAVPRGVLIEGRVIDRDKRPIADASIYYVPTEDESTTGTRSLSGLAAGVSSGPDGRYAIAVAPGKGTLLVCGPTPDYALKAVTWPHRHPEYAHAFIPYDVEVGPNPVVIDPLLELGAKVVGRVEDPQGRPVEHADIVTTGAFSTYQSSWGGPLSIPVRDGRFEIPGATVGQPMKCWFLDAVRGLGASVELDAATPVVVKLQPTGAARMRVLDLQGRPNPAGSSWLSVVASPGPGMRHAYLGLTLTEDERRKPLAEEITYNAFDRLNNRTRPKPDADGRLIFPNLIPGATYRIYEVVPELGPEVVRWRDFTVAPGQTIDLGDVRTKPVGS